LGLQEVYSISGGINAWQDDGLPVTTGHEERPWVAIEYSGCDDN
jgi:3-mercaptopyruvate sulfurtransferase SseA